MIEEAYVSFETAKLLKEKGFNIKCTAYYPQHIMPSKLTFGGRVNYNNDSKWKYKMLPPISAPTQQMVMQWLREIHYIAIVIDCWFGGTRYISWHGKIMCYGDNLKTQQDVDMPYVATYEEAVEEAIKYCLENFDLNEY